MSDVNRSTGIVESTLHTFAGLPPVQRVGTYSVYRSLAGQLRIDAKEGRRPVDPDYLAAVTEVVAGMERMLGITK